MKKPINTQQEAKENPFLFIAESMAQGTSNAIERQEAEGQKSFVNSTTLPTKYGISLSDQAEGREILESFGIKFIKTVENDPLFQYVELPGGWKKVSTEHSMWSKLIDEKGRERANIFYKAAFYDRDAHISILSRFNFEIDYEKRTSEQVSIAVVKDGETIIHTTEPKNIINLPYEHDEISLQEAKKWLDEKYPDWKNPKTYWEESEEER